MKRMRLRRSKRLWREMKSGAGLLWWREPPGRKTMQALSDRLEDEWLRGLRVLKRRSEQPDELEGVHEAQVHLSRAMVAVGRLVDGSAINLDGSRRLVGELSEKTMTALTG